MIFATVNQILLFVCTLKPLQTIHPITLSTAEVGALYIIKVDLELSDGSKHKIHHHSSQKMQKYGTLIVKMLQLVTKIL